MMHLFLHVSDGRRDERMMLFERLRRTIDREDLLVVTSESQTATAPSLALETIDAFVLEGSSADADSGYLLAHAIAMKKPTLVLYPRGTEAKALHHMSLPSIPSWIAVESYTDRSLERQLEDFLLTVGGRRLKPSPRIKFTLRITSQIEEFLRFKTVNTKVSKADWVRDQLERFMADDREWQLALRSRQRGGTETS